LRLAVRYLVVYAVVLGMASGALLWSTRRHLDPALTEELETEFVALVQGYESSGGATLAQALEQRIAQGRDSRRIYLLVTPAGEKVVGNLLAWPTETGLRYDGRVQGVWVEEEAMPRGLHEDDAYWPVIATRLPDGSRLLLARAVEQQEGLHELAEYLLEALPVALLLALALGVTMARAMLRRVDLIGATAEEIMRGDLARRVPVSARADEFDALAGRLNAMLDRIQSLIKGIRTVTDNIAHDLRSPLSRLRSRLELTLLEARGEAQYREAIERSIEDTASLIRTFNALLSISQTESGNHRTEWGRVDLNRLAQDLVELYAAAAEAQDLRLELSGAQLAEVIGSRDLLAQALANLLDNAIKYTPAGGVVRVQVRTAEKGVEISVADSGPGIPAAERDRVLERFVRLDGARHTPGNGLGLSLVQAVASLHQATLTLEDAAPGLVVTLRFVTAA
jgi:signal transduction histidine kinase